MSKGVVDAVSTHSTRNPKAQRNKGRFKKHEWIERRRDVFNNI